MPDPLDAYIDSMVGTTDTPKWDLKQRGDGTWVWVNRETREVAPAPEMGGPQIEQPAGKYITDKGGNQVYIPPSDLGPGQQGPLQPGREVYHDPYAEQDRQRAAAEAERKRLLEQADRQLAADNAAISRALQERRLSLDEAQAAATQAHQRILEQLQAQQNEISQRGQDMTMATTLASQGTQAAMESLKYGASPTTVQNLNNVAQGWQKFGAAPVNVQPMDMGFDPATLPAQLTASILKNMSPTAASIAGQQPQGQGFQLPPMNAGRVPAPISFQG